MSEKCPKIVCPKCGEAEKSYPNGIVSWGRKGSAYHCGACNTYWTEWQQDEITRLQERIRVLDEGPKIICLCGSGRFKNAFDDAEFQQTVSGNIVLTIGCNTKDIARDIDWNHLKPMLDELHKRKIDLAHEVFVINVDGYIGESTRSEIEYATKLGKPIKYLEPSAALEAGKKEGEDA